MDRYLEELVDGLPPRSREHYVPGVETSIEYDLVPEIISLHKRWSVGDMSLDINMYVILDKYLEAKKQEGIDLDPQTTLDSLIWRSCREDFEISAFLIEKLAAAFHRIGYNGFTLNYTSLPGEHDMLARSLNGQAGRELRVTYVADYAKDVGSYAHSCWIDYHGDAQSVGSMATNSTFIIHGTAGCVGKSAQYCTFIIDDHSSIPTTSHFQFKGNSYYVKNGVPDEVASLLKSMRFFEDDNHIYTRNDNGNWKEVKP